MEAAQAHGDSCNGAAGLFESVSPAHGTGAPGVPPAGERSWGAGRGGSHSSRAGFGVSAGSCVPLG